VIVTKVYPEAVHRQEKKSGTTATGRAFLQMLEVFAEFETNLRRERQLAGIAQTMAKGQHLGRKASLTDDQNQEIRQLHQAGMTQTALFHRYGVSQATIYKALKGA
jgi:DNA invertase Pin-like site-specific DNA recombinase